MKRFPLVLLCVLAATMLCGTVSASGAEGGGGGISFGDINWFGYDQNQPGVGWMIVNFAIFAYLLVRLGKKPIQKYFLERHHAVRHAIEEAQKVKASAEEIVKTYSERLAHLDAEVDKIVAAFEDEGKLEQSRILSAAEKAAEKIKRDATLVIEQEQVRHQLEMRREAVGMAMEMAEKILSEKLSDADRQRIDQEYIENLRGMSA